MNFFVIILVLLLSSFAQASDHPYVAYEKVIKNGNNFEECQFNDNSTSERECMIKIDTTCNNQSGNRDMRDCWSRYKDWSQRRVDKLISILQVNSHSDYINNTHKKFEEYVLSWCKAEAICQLSYNLKRTYDLELKYCYMGKCFVAPAANKPIKRD